VHDRAYAQLAGPLVLLNPDVTPPGPYSLNEAPETTNISYSNTANTLTLDTGLAYNITYANIVGGIAHYFIFTGKDSATSGCAKSGTAMRQ
jgi:hypothetical protein